MTHYHGMINDANGDLIGLIPLCSDSCHQKYDARKHLAYEGWNGGHEQNDYNEYCENCGVICSCGPEACEHQRDNFIVNRFLTRDGERCDHGNWIQVPARMIHRSF